MQKKLIIIFLTVSSLYSVLASASKKDNIDYYWHWKDTANPLQSTRHDFLKSYYAGIPLVFDINDPARVTSQFSNWSDIDENYFIPKIVQEISTQGRSANTSNTSLGIKRIAKAGHYIYTPALEVDDYYKHHNYVLKDLGEYQVFDLNILQRRTLAGPDLSTTGYALSINPSPKYFSYNSFNFSLSPSGELAVRLFWLTDLSTKDRREGVVVWQPENGKVEKVILLPINFQGDRAKNSCAFKHNNGERGYPCIFEDQSGAVLSQPSITQAAPLNPFFNNESEVLLPIIFFKKTLSSDRKNYQQNVNFFFQPIQLTSNDQKWLFSTTKGIYHDVFKIDPVARQHELVNIQKTHKFSCLKDIYTYSYMLYYNFESKKSDCDLTTPTFSTQKIDNTNMIVGSGSFYGNYTDPSAYYDKTRYAAHWDNMYFLADDQSQISYRIKTTASTTSFYPSILPPYYFNSDVDILSPADLFVGNKKGPDSWRYGTDIEYVWSDPTLPEGYYFAKLTSIVPFLNNDEKAHYRVMNIEPFTSVVPVEKLESTWVSNALAVIQFSPKKKYIHTGKDECQFFSALNIKICNKLYYDATNPHLISSGNLYLENGDRLLIPEFSHQTSVGGTYRNPSYQSETVYKMTLPQKNDVEIIIKINSSKQCELVANSVVCKDSQTSSAIEGKLTKDKIDYPLDSRLL